MKQENRYIAWFIGTMNRHGIIATSRKEAIAKFATLHGVNVSHYIQARKCKPSGEYCLLPSGEYGFLHN